MVDSDLLNPGTTIILRNGQRKKIEFKYRGVNLWWANSIKPLILDWKSFKTEHVVGGQKVCLMDIERIL